MSVSLPRSAPEKQGVPSSAIAEVVKALDTGSDSLHGLMILRHGHVIAEGWWHPYQAADPHMLFSLSKSFTSTAAGLAIAEGHFTLDDPVVSFFPDELPDEVEGNLAEMRVRHLLSMSTGHDEDTLGFITRASEGDWARAFLARPVPREPGTHFLYNSGATYMVSAIVQRTTGQTVLDYLRPRLLDPLGIEQATWECCPKGVNTGGWGMSVTTETIARFGLLYLWDGLWEGQRILPEGWVAEASRKHVSNGDDPDSDWAQGYGFQFWRSRHSTYRGDGAFGQYCVVMPEQDCVVAITSGLGDMQAVLNVLWDKLLPAMQSETLTPEEPAAEALKQQLNDLALPVPEGRPESPNAAAVSGITWRLAENAQGLEWLRLDLEQQLLSGHGKHGDLDLKFGLNGEWLAGELVWDGPPSQAAATAAWTTPHTLAIRVALTRTPFVPTIVLRFEAGKLFVGYVMNVSFGPVAQPEIAGESMT